MIDERAFIAEVETASADRFAEILRSADMEQQRALQAHFGAQKFDRLRSLAQQQVTRGVGKKKGKLVLLAGILGSEITVTNKVWFSPWRIVLGDFELLQLDSSGKPLKPSSATGMLRRYYGEIEQSLLVDWDVLSFPFDWRMDIRDSADRLAAAIAKQFGTADGVHLVAHSMGGLVSRSMAQRHGDVWAKMGKLIMLGTPNHGSLAIPQLYTGMYRLIRVIAAIDTRHNVGQLLQFAKLFVGTYQMLPRIELLQQTTNPEKVFEPGSYGELNPPPARLQDAKQFQQEIDAVLNPERMVYIAGSNQPTADGVSDWTKLGSVDGYHMTALGDGTVPHSLGLLKDVQTYYVAAEHSALPDNDAVIAAVKQVLVGDAVALPTVPITARGVENEEALRRAQQIQDDAAVAQASVLATRLAGTRGANAVVVAPEEKDIADLAFIGRTQEPMAAAMAAGVSSGGGAGFAPGVARSQVVNSPTPETPVAQAMPKLCVNICHCGIELIGTDQGPAMTPKVDAIAVGHYVGVMPVFAELALDKAISTDVIAAFESDMTPLDEGDKDAFGLIAQFTQRGILRGELGRPFFLPDPREPERLIVIAGMGSVGRFGDAELTVLAREAFWSLAVLGKKHLASVLIGSGAGNLDSETALRAWLRGMAFAVANRPDTPRLDQVTFVEHDVAKAEEVRQIALQLQASIRCLGLEIDVTPKEPFAMDPEAQSASGKTSLEKSRERRRHPTAATRVIVEQQDNFFRFGALSEDASWPERALKIDPKIVQQANDSLAVQGDNKAAREWGSFLFKLMVPQDVQSRLSESAPIVLACDSNVAQIHWELMVAPDSAGAAVSDGFLGLSPGVTRQLRNNFQGIPEPPPPSRRTIRVLVIGDTCYENPLPGAAAEAAAVVKVFQDLESRLTAAGSKVRIEVEALIGPNNATCVQVLKRLLTQTYDILHYSGHCEFVKADPSSSGWLFSNGLRLSANELTRVDRVPAFVFSNACESGVTPSRPDLRSPELAPSFAESFFARGVKNFVCTAWPVQDNAAAAFAAEFYANLLGKDSGKPSYMYEAMVSARQVVAQKFDGVQGWAAYQHYGNPYFRMV